MIEIGKGIIGITTDRKMLVFESEEEFADYDKEKLALFYTGLHHLIEHLNEI